MNTNTIKAIQKRIDHSGVIDSEFTIGENHYVIHTNNPVFKPYVIKYRKYSSFPFHAGNIDDNGKFYPAMFSEKR